MKQVRNHDLAATAAGHRAIERSGGRALVACTIWAALAGSVLAAQSLELRTAESVLSFSGATGASVSIASRTPQSATVVVDEPVQIFVCRLQQESGSATKRCAQPEGEPMQGFGDPADRLTSKYEAVRRVSPTQIDASAIVRSKTGAEFEVKDRYRTLSGFADIFIMSRTVRVLHKADAGEVAFNSLYELEFAGKTTGPDTLHFFAPALWYDRNTRAAAGAIATEFAHHEYAYWRETRSSMPMVMMQEGGSGAAVALAHVGDAGYGSPQVTSGADERSREWLADASVQFGALGAAKDGSHEQSPKVKIGFIYPAQEGEITYVAGKAPRWARRSHPADPSVRHSYTLAICADSFANPYGTRGEAGSEFASALRGTWRRFFDLFSPEIAADVSTNLWTAEIRLLNTVFSHQGPLQAPGFPFKIGNLRTGEDNPYSYQMGFTGQQIPLGFELLRYGTLNHESASLEQGREILNFWATEDPKAQKSALPMTWYQPNAPEARRWSNLACSRPIFLRTVSDGMEGMASAIAFARDHGSAADRTEVDKWESFATGFADWLVKHQAADGSFQRAFNPDGTPWKAGPACSYRGDVDGESKYSTPFPIRFLVAMWFATANPAYKQAAVRAGEWAYEHIYLSTAFVGGVANRNALDKEAGAEALEAALALYDLAQQAGNKRDAAKWLGAAELAADYLETWQYVWKFVPRDSTSGTMFRAYTHVGTMADSFIGTGESASDVFLAIASFNYYRLHLLSGEGAGGHYGKFAELLENNTALATQMASVPGQDFGWKYDGLTGEAINLTNLQFVDPQIPIGWLAWISNSQLNPMQRLEDAFGSRSVTELLKAEQVSVRVRSKLENASRHLNPARGMQNGK